MKPAVTILISLALAGASAPSAQEQIVFDHGEWDTSMEIIALDAPQLSEETRQELRRAFAGMGDRQCLGGTSDVVQDFQSGVVEGFRAMLPGGSCRFEESEAANGVFRGIAVCRAPKGRVETTTRFEGSYSASSITGSFTSSVQQTGSTGAPPHLRLEVRFKMHRVGPCPAA